ncbi:MAG: RagB/SusD family nutrient uptake outer membrane protein [Tannerellaceae bacterium]|nr:RagB/SusD family nutrient uptake outer membrane protein [Tannerellaceae bacterium]
MKTKQFISILLMAVLLFSCDFLDETAYNKVTVGNFYTTKDGITNGVNGLYSTLRKLYIDEYFIYMCEGPTDIQLCINGPDQFRDWTIDASSSTVASLWNNCYQSINQCNAVLEALQTYEYEGMSEELQERFIAEALFIRAHFYYHLVQQFGDVPMPLTPTTTAVTTAVKTEKAKVWEQVINDLEESVRILPETYTAADYGRATKFAAMHHLAKVLLTVKRDNQDLNRALTLAEQIINTGPYGLVATHAELWDINNKYNPEVIFPVLYTQNAELNGNGNTSHMYFCSAYSEEHDGVKRVIEYGRPWSRLQPTDYMLDLIDETMDNRFEECFISSWNITEDVYVEDVFNPVTKQMQTITWQKGDLAMIAPKKAWTKEQIQAVWPVLVFLPEVMRANIDPATQVQSEAYPDAEWPSNTRFMSYKMYPYLVKCLDPNRPEVNWTAGSRDVYVFRLGETYLLAAEAAHLLGDNGRAAGHINEIRRRAAVPGKEPDMEVSSSDIDMDFILDERARELIGEMHRWYDLQRSGKMMERMNNPAMNPTVAGKFKDFHILRPIPRDQLLNVTNPEEFIQNPGYGN